MTGFLHLFKGKLSNYSLTFIALFFLGFLLTFSGWAQTQTVTSDRLDYQPGDTAIITGTGWTNDQFVDVHIEENPVINHSHDYHDRVVNSDGTWMIYLPILESHLGVTFTVIVEGKQSGAIATTVFTDALAFSATISPLTICASTSQSFSIVITNNTVAPPTGANARFSSFKITTPSGFTVSSPTDDVSNFSVSIVGGNIEGVRGSGNGRSPGESITVTFIANAPGVASNPYVWAIDVWVGNDLGAGTPNPSVKFPDPISFPSITVHSAPVLTSPGNLSANTVVGLCTSVVSYSVPATGTPAPVISYTFSGVTSGSGSGTGSGSTFNKGITTVNVTATNSCGSDNKMFTVTVNDNQAPIITYPGGITQNNDTDVCGATVNFAATATDNCPGTVITYSKNPGTVFPVGTTVVMATATDASGNSETGSFGVTVVDNQTPIIICPGDFAVNNDIDACGAVVTYSVTSTDNCPGQTVAQTSGLASGSEFPIGTTTNTFVVTDASGLTATCSFDVVVTDDEIPVITLTGDNPQILESCDSYTELGATIVDCELGLSVTIDASAVDMSTPGSYSVTYNVTDTAGNIADQKTRTVTVQDTEAPVITLTGDNPQILESCDSYTELGATIVDCELGLSVTIDASAVDMSTPGSYSVTYNVTDTAGNIADQKTRTVTVQDTEAPVITLTGANPQVLESCTSYIELGATVSDCEPGLTVVIDASAVDMSTPGDYTVTYNVTDAAGNPATEITRTVTVEDTTPPEISCMADQTKANNPGTCTYTVVGDEFDPIFSDNCGGATISNNYNSGSTLAGAVFNVGVPTVVVWTAKDAAGNETNCSFTLTVTNNDPIITNISGPAGPQQKGTSVTLTANYYDNNLASAEWKVSSNGVLVTTQQGTITSTTVTGTFNLNPDVYVVELTITDHCGKTDVAFYEYIVVYDPTGGFVTGGGWIDSPAGASKLYPLVTGKANFGFNAKYKTGKNNTNEVDGNTNFQFKAGDLHFSSSVHHNMSLVISGAKATYTGEGTVNGRGSYEFRLIAIDGDLLGNSADKFRIKIWTKGYPGDVIYDNKMNTSESSDDATVLGGGSIVIHKPKGKGQEETLVKTTPIIMQEMNPEILETLAASPIPVVSFSTVRFSVNEDANVVLRVYDYSGRMIETLYNGQAKAYQNYDVDFQRRNLMSGIYIVKLTTDKGQSYDKRIIVE